MTLPDTIVTINLGDPTGDREFTFADVQRLIRDCIESTNYADAALVSIQLADQLPNDLWPHLIAAESLYLHQQIDPALQYINRALAIDPGDIASLVVKSRLCMYRGQHSDAIELINTAIDIAPQNAQLQYEKGALMADAGNLADARDAYCKSVKYDARKAGGLLGLAQLPGDNFSDELIKRVEFLIQSRQFRGEEQIKARFALAHAYEKKGNIAKHFAHLNAGNELKNRSLHYDPVVSETEARQTIEFFSEEFFRRRKRANGNSAKLIFIVGFPRCGSTLVEQVLASHPLVSAAGETFALTHAIRAIQQSRHILADYPCWIESQSDEILAEIADDYLHRVGQFTQNGYLTDKLLNNYMHVGLIHLIFPNARIVNVQRHPIDSCYSCYKQLFHLSSVPFAYSLENLASKYRDYSQIIEHWNKVLPGTIHTVEYEQLVKKQQQVTRDLLDYCGLPWHDACLNFQDNARTVQTSSNIQVRQPLYTNSIDRWQSCREYLGPLMALV